MKIFKMTDSELSGMEQHISTLIGVMVVGLLSWVLVSVNDMQVTMGEVRLELRYINSQMDDRLVFTKQLDSRIDVLERRMDTAESERKSHSSVHNGLP